MFQRRVKSLGVRNQLVSDLSTKRHNIHVVVVFRGYSAMLRSKTLNVLWPLLQTFHKLCTFGTRYRSILSYYLSKIVF